MATATERPEKPLWKQKRVRTPTVLQMEAVECGAAALAMILAYHGRIVPLEELRVECGVSRDGSKASNMLKAARKYGLEAHGFSMDPEELKGLPLPMILFWNFNHFVVLEGFRRGHAYLNDPGTGPRVVSMEEFNISFTGIVLGFEPTPQFKKGGERRPLLASLANRLAGLKTALAYVVLAGLLLVIPGLILPAFSKIFVDDILITRMDGWLAPLLLAMGITAVFRGLLTMLQESHLLKIEAKLAVTGSARFFHHLVRLPMEFFVQRMAGEIGSRVRLNDDVAQLLSGKLATTVFSLVMGVFYAVVMLCYDAVLTMVGVGIAALNLAALKLVSKKRNIMNQRLQQEIGKTLALSMNGLQMIETLKAGGMEGDFFEQWAGYQAKAENAQQELSVSSQLLAAVPAFLTALNTAAILAVGGLRVINGDMTMGSLVAFQSLMASFMGPVNQLVTLGSKLQETKTDIKRLDDVLRHAPDFSFLTEVTSGGAVPQAPLTKLTGELELRNVTFGYSRLAPPLIRHFNLKLAPGTRVALVGVSGSGKSTVAKLVAGLYEPWEGQILFDGKSRGELPRSLVTNSVSMVDQDCCLFEDSVRNNIAMWDDTIPEEDVSEAAGDACISDDIISRPGAYHSKVKEAGSNFSGGQRQRLEIARALVNNPALLVLDEATSALDPNTEKIVDDNLRRRGCTCLIIAHRLSTIRDCDEIIVLEKGEVVQRGTHEELRNAEGIYAEMIKIQ
ncbi:MAG: NHLP family bacteriocin export ABC transporter peptidase/permease/ATPase subunit [Deltaproteobacteria bacterium]|nr:NHLP family bacteriocin export ABC transporter peptidase/permease/ATPase subunit [Deltaproteobacteria bacterium]